MPNNRLWACMFEAAALLFYTLSFANGKYILTGNGEQVAFTEASECSQFLYQKKMQGKTEHYRERRRRISEFNRSHRKDLYAGEVREFGL